MAAGGEVAGGQRVSNAAAAGCSWVARIYSQWMSDELSAHPDAIVLMPLLNLDELYGPGPVGMNLVMQPIFDAAGRANIDPARVYLIGHSMAADAVWNLAIITRPISRRLIRWRVRCTMRGSGFGWGTFRTFCVLSGTMLRMMS